MVRKVRCRIPGPRGQNGVGIIPVLQYRGGGIGNIESHASAIYAYDVRTEILGTKGAVFVGSIEQAPAVFLSANGSSQMLADHFLIRFADAYLAEVRDFVQNVLEDKPVRVTGGDGLKALATAVAAENSIKQGRGGKSDAGTLGDYVSLIGTGSGEEFYDPGDRDGIQESAA